jgi:hypothetical protein
MHRVGPGKIIAGEKDEVGLLSIDGLDGEREALEVLVAIDVKIANLARDDSAQSCGQSAHRQFKRGNLNLVDRAPPHPMQRAQRQRRLPLGASGSGCSRFVRRRVVD